MTEACCVGKGTTVPNTKHSRRDDVLSTTTWGVALLWGALVWLLHETGVLAASGMPLSPGALFFVGFGSIVAMAIAVTLLVPGFKHADFLSYVLAAGAFGLALDSWRYIWPVVLAVLGAVLIVGSVRQFGSTDQAGSEGSR